MLTITQAQTLLAIDDEPGFLAWYVDAFMPDHLPEFHRAFRRDDLIGMVGRGRRVAIARGFDDPASQAHFVTLMWTMGPNFHHFPGFREIARDRSQPGSLRIDRFYREVSSEQGADAVLGADDRYWFTDPADKGGA